VSPAAGPAELVRGVATPFGLDLEFVGVAVRVLTNDQSIWSGLHRYYARYRCERAGDPVAVVRLIQGLAEAPDGVTDLERGGGKQAKEAVRDVPGGRLVLKKATGVVMGLWPGQAVAVGDVRANLNQGINLVNACYAKAVLARGHLLLHASGVTGDGRTAALAGPPGAGKSTAALYCVEGGFRFLSNDRVLARPDPGGAEALGYPKQPRVNPGTLLHHPRLRSLLKPEDRERLATMAPRQLWELERKADVDLDAIYGPGTVDLRGRLHVLILLKWSLEGRGFQVRDLDTTEALANVPFLHKDLGAFDLDRPARADRAVHRLSAYAALLSRLRVVEVTGHTDFAALVDLVGGLLAADRGARRRTA
jgi:HprK-related kinase B